MTRPWPPDSYMGDDNNNVLLNDSNDDPFEPETSDEKIDAFEDWWAEKGLVLGNVGKPLIDVIKLVAYEAWEAGAEWFLDALDEPVRLPPVNSYRIRVKIVPETGRLT